MDPAEPSPLRSPAVLEHLRSVGRKFGVVAALMLAASSFFALRLKGALGAGAPMIALVAFALVPLLAAGGLGWALFLVRFPRWHPTLRRLERLSPGATQRVIDAFDAEDFVVRHGALRVTRDAAVLLAPFGLEARLIEDLAWIHPTVTKVLYGGALVQSALALTLRFRRSPNLDLGVTEADSEALTEMLRKHWPGVVVGWSEELEARWRRDRAGFGVAAPQPVRE